MNGKRKRRERIRRQQKLQTRRERKRLIQFFGVGICTFLIGVFVGAAYLQDIKSFTETAGRVQAVEAATPAKDSGTEDVGTEADVKEENEKGQMDENPEEEEPRQEENLPTDWNLLLVNRTHPLPENFEVELKNIGSGYQLDARIVDEYKAMIQAARVEGISIYITSAYRSMTKQVELHQNKVMDCVREGFSYEESQALASTVVAVPGTSEHQLGLAVDLVSYQYRNLDEKQEDTRSFQWLKEHCWEYGFILRYPNGTTDITGIIYEPWHFRYVGKEAAKEITEKGITLEEYLGAVPVSEAEQV